MARTVIAVFESMYLAKQAVWALVNQGFPREQIDVFAEPPTKHSNEPAKPEKVRSELAVDELHAGASIGAGIGGALGITGGLLIGLGALHIPPFLAWLGGGTQAIAELAPAVAGLGTAAGGLAGSLISGLVGLGIDEEEIRQYAKNVRKGEITVTVLAEWDAVDGAIEILRNHNPLDLQQRSMVRQKAGLPEKKLVERVRHGKSTEQNRPR